jgi:hypothetical protein
VLRFSVLQNLAAPPSDERLYGIERPAM